MSTTLDDPNWVGTTVLRGGPGLEGDIRTLTEAQGSDIVLTGSITLAGHLLQRSLVDELRLFVYPIALGHGRRIFPDLRSPCRLELFEQRSIHDVVLMRYRIPR